ncbi:unnamed protein product [Mytilus edulis]|uniref:Uncharacterized protein n=1 Tax=Mytilus edulis TaxID=6550 RepID=A0A8S3RFJ8_MYTED|nr:unnamed protein product [Mytilus edulis]
MPDVDSTLRQIAQWKHIVISDLTKSFYQIPLHGDSMKYCGVSTPFCGVRVYVRSAMGMPGSETALEELTCRVLGHLVQEGVVAKIADDLYCGNRSPEELLTNWERVLQALQKCSLNLSATKTIIAPKQATILGWIWELGSIRASPHRIATLSNCQPPKTVRALRSFVGAYKVLSRVIKNSSGLLSQLENAVAGSESKDTILWTEELNSALTSAQNAFSTNRSIALPRPNDQLWIVTGRALKTCGLGATLYINRNDKLLLVGFFIAKLRQTQRQWLPCEIEALSIAASIEHFSPYIIQSLSTACSVVRIVRIASMEKPIPRKIYIQGQLVTIRYEGQQNLKKCYKCNEYGLAIDCRNEPNRRWEQKDYDFKCGRYGHKSTELYNDKHVPYKNNTDDNGNSDKENPQPYDISQYAEVDDQNIDSSYTHSKFCSFDTGTRYFGQGFPSPPKKDHIENTEEFVINVIFDNSLESNNQYQTENTTYKNNWETEESWEQDNQDNITNKQEIIQQNELQIGNKGVKTRIDKICISEALKHKIRDLKHMPYQYTDHKIVYISLKLQKTKWGNGYWKMNDSLLDKELYTKYINNFWINWKQRKSNYNILDWWEIGKKKIKELMIRFSKQLVARERKEL